jgi:hypothetical protein
MRIDELPILEQLPEHVETFLQEDARSLGAFLRLGKATAPAGHRERYRLQ